MAKLTEEEFNALYDAIIGVAATVAVTVVAVGTNRPFREIESNAAAKVDKLRRMLTED
jgi:hypothetical protein